MLPDRSMTAADIDDELRQLRSEYRQSLGETIRTIEKHARGLSNAARVKTSFPVLLYLTHQIKGTAGTLGFPEVSEIARELARSLEDFLSPQTPTVSRESISETAIEAVEKLKSAISA